MASAPLDSIDDENRRLARLVLDRARELGVTLGSAESCTGGMIAAAITAIRGSSDSFVGGVVSYWVDVKERVLGVEGRIIDEHGVVSHETARAMAEGARMTLACDYAVATTGIARPYRSRIRQAGRHGVLWRGGSLGHEELHDMHREDA